MATALPKNRPTRVTSQSIYLDQQEGRHEKRKARAEADKISNLFKKLQQQEWLAGAQAHAQSNRAGWDDDYDPMDDENTIWLT